MAIRWYNSTRLRSFGPSRTIGEIQIQDDFALEVKTFRKVGMITADIRLDLIHFDRWNKLDLDHYLSVMQETGEEVAFPLKHERPFWFSKVKSY